LRGARAPTADLIPRVAAGSPQSLSRTLSLDHLVVTASSLADTVRDWREAGFSVSGGGRHRGSPTRNELVPFPDGGYVELLSAVPPGLPRRLRLLRNTSRWHHILERRGPLHGRFLEALAGPDGAVDWCLGLPPGVDPPPVEMLGGGGLPMGRLRGDGVELRWEIFVPAVRRLPFLIRDRTSRELRVPQVGATHHPCGAAGVGEVLVRTRDPEAVTRGLTALLGPPGTGATGAPEWWIPPGARVVVEEGEHEALAARLREAGGALRPLPRPSSAGRGISAG